MSGIPGKTRDSSSRRSILLIEIGTKSPSYPATAIGTIGTNSATKTHFSATALFRFSATNSPPRDSPSTSRCIAASPSQIRFQPGATAHSTPRRNKLQSCLRYDDRNNSSHRNLHGTPRHCHPSYSHQPYGTPRPARVGTRSQSCFRYGDRNKFTGRDTDQAQPQALSSYGSRPRGTPLHTPIGTRRKAAPDTNIGTTRGGHPFSPKEEVSMVANRASPDPSGAR